MHRTLQTLGNEKDQNQIKFYKKRSSKLISSWATKNLKIIYFTHPIGQVLKNKGYIIDKRKLIWYMIPNRN